MALMRAVMGVEVARKGDAGKTGSVTLTDRLHDDHLHIFEIHPPYQERALLSTSLRHMNVKPKQTPTVY